MIFFLWMVSAEPSELPVSDQKVIRYILDKETENTVQKETAPAPVQTDDQLEERLLRPDSTIEQEIQERDPANLPWWWVLVLLAILAGSIRLFVNRSKEQLQSVNVLSRTFFGREGSVAVVEVQDAGQNVKRFLLGFNTGSPPTFLADLSAPVAFPDIVPVTPSFDDLKVSMPKPRPVSEKEKPKSVRRKTKKDSTAEPRRNVTPSPQKLDILVGEPNTSEKEELVEEILRLRETKHGETEKVEEKKEARPENRDRWADGFNEIFRK